MNFESSIKLPFLLAAACFCVTLKELTWPVEFCLCGLQMEMETEFCFHLFPLKKSLKVPFPFVSVKANFESSVKISFLLAALCFHVNPYYRGTEFQRAFARYLACMGIE